MNIQVTRSSMPSFEEYCNEIRDLWDSHWLTNNGEKHIRLTAELEARLDAPHVQLFCNGHLALESLIEAMDLHGEIITTPFTFASTTHAAVRKGLTPVFCDIRDEDYTLDAAKIEPLITDRTCAILPVHVYGTLCDTEAIERVAQKYHLPVIYDAAHAFGVRKAGVSAACFGSASMFSFHATKVFQTIEGGCVATSDSALSEKLALVRNYGITGPEDDVLVGGNAKMNEFQAAMGLCNLRHLSDCIARRGKVWQAYTDLLERVPGIRLLRYPGDITPNYAYYPVFFEDGMAMRDRVFAALADQGIGTRKYFYPLLTDLTCYRGRYSSADTPVAKRISDGILTLPMFADLSETDAERIAKIVADEVRHG